MLLSKLIHVATKTQRVLNRVRRQPYIKAIDELLKSRDAGELIDSPEWSQCPQQSEDAQNAETVALSVRRRQRNDDVDERYSNQASVHHVPSALQIRVSTDVHTFGGHLQLIAMATPLFLAQVPP